MQSLKYTINFNYTSETKIVWTFPCVTFFLLYAKEYKPEMEMKNKKQKTNLVACAILLQGFSLKLPLCKVWNISLSQFLIAMTSSLCLRGFLTAFTCPLLVNDEFPL